MPDDRHDLTRGPVGAHLRRQAVPFGLGLVAIFSFEAIDLFFIAQLGEAPLAAVAFTLPVVWLTYGIGIGLEAGTASCVSRAVGRRDDGYARRLTTDAGLLGLLIAIALLVLGLSTIDPVFTMLGATPELMPLIREYMSVWFWVAPLDMVLWTMLASMRARGNTALEARIITSAALLNLAIDPVLIFGLLGFPKMGVAGAALATVISTGLMLLVTLYLLVIRLRVMATVRTSLARRLEAWKHLMQIGFPAMITNAIIPVSSGIIVALIADYGVNAVAGYGIAMRIEPMALIPFYALSAVTSPFFGQNIGGAHFDRLREARRVLTRFCALLGLALAMTVAATAPLITSWYTSSPEIATVTHHYFWIAAWGWGAYGLVMSVNAGFNGSGRPLPAVILSMLRVIGVLLPLVALGRWMLGLDGIFFAVLASNLLLGVVGWRWLGRHIQREARVSGEW